VTDRTGLSNAPWHRDAKVAVVQGPLSWDYAELTARVTRRAERLRAQGLAAGQVVLVPEVSTLDLHIMQYALARLGCGLLPVSLHCGEERAAALVRMAGVEWRWDRDAGEGGGLVATGIGHRSAARRRVRPALVIETSGSGGVPKAVMLTPENVLASAALVNGRLGLCEGDSWLSCLPRSHVGGLTIGYRCALAGAAVVLHEQFDAAAVARDLERHRVTHLSLVPPMLARLLAATDKPPGCLRVLLVGGQALSGALARQAIDAGWPLHLTYGMTETGSQVATSGALAAVPGPGAVGPVLPGIRVRCEGTPASPRRIAIRGPVVMAGYANPERLPGVGLEDGWFVTNDLGYLSESGDLAVPGRVDEILIIGGEAVLPSRVEDRMMSAPGLESVVVAGLQDPVWGHRLVAVYTGGIAPDALDGWCRAHLPDRERPRGYRRLCRLPLLASGKPDRRRIEAMIVNSD
jgi:O-succinylbenzoic acid--CoA ligase